MPADHDAGIGHRLASNVVSVGNGRTGTPLRKPKGLSERPVVGAGSAPPEVRTLINEIPDVFPISFQPQTLDSWVESQVEQRWRARAVNGYSAQSPIIEILRIQWGQHKG
jgi:hypothetical protein